MRFCLVMKGKIQINRSKNGKKKQYHKEKMILKLGDRTGAESLLLQKPNLYTLSVDSEYVVLLEVSRPLFDKFLRNEEESRFKTNMDFLK